MNKHWLKISASLQKGITIVNMLEETKFEQFLKRIIVRFRNQHSEIFNEEERRKLEVIFKVNEDQLLLAIKTLLYIYKRMLKFIFIPITLKNELISTGIDSEKVNIIVKLWSADTAATLDEIASRVDDKQEDGMSFSWQLNAELSSDYHRKCKVPKAYLSISGSNHETELELTHQELYSMFLQFESIQNELDNLMLT